MRMLTDHHDDSSNVQIIRIQAQRWIDLNEGNKNRVISLTKVRDNLQESIRKETSKMKNDDMAYAKISVFKIIEEYVRNGNLMSKNSFGIEEYENKSMRISGFEFVGDDDGFGMFEKEFFVSYVKSEVSVNFKALFLNGEYINTYFSFHSKRVKLATIILFLKKLDKKNVNFLKMYYLNNFNHGALIFDDRLVFRFELMGSGYVATTLETIFSSYDEFNGSLSVTSVKKWMAPLLPSQMNTLPLQRLARLLY